MLCRILLSVYIFKANRTQSASSDNGKKKENILKDHKICRKFHWYILLYTLWIFIFPYSNAPLDVWQATSLKIYYYINFIYAIWTPLQYSRHHSNFLLLLAIINIREQKISKLIYNFIVSYTNYFLFFYFRSPCHSCKH